MQATPYAHALTHGVYDKLLITISGTIKQNPDKYGWMEHVHVHASVRVHVCASAVQGSFSGQGPLS